VRNRLSVAINWLWIYARDQRGARLITWWGGEVEGTAPFPRAEQADQDSSQARRQGTS
jgi:NADH:ubiquinone reductase (H+-translocating)